MSTATFRIWTRVAKSTSFDNNCYTTSACIDYLLPKLDPNNQNTVTWFIPIQYKGFIHNYVVSSNRCYLKVIVICLHSYMESSITDTNNFQIDLFDT